MGIRALDDRDPSIVYSTGWAQAGSSLEYNSTTTFTALAGSAARISFRGTAIGVYGTISARDKGSVAPESLYSIDGGLPVRFRAAQAPRPQYSQRFFQSPVLPEADHVLTVMNAGVRADPFFLDFVMVQSNEDIPPASSLTPSLSSSSSVPLSTSTSTTTTPPPPVTVTVTSVQATSAPPTGVAGDAKASNTAVAVSGASKSNAGAVAGGIIAAIVVLFLAGFGFIMWRRKRARRETLFKSSSGIMWARPEIDSPPARVQLDTPPPPAAPVMSQNNGGQYNGNYYPSGYGSANSYNNYQPQPQQQYQQQQQPAHSNYDYSSSGEHDAYGGITQSQQPYPQQGYIPPSQLMNAGAGNDYSGYHRGGVPS